MARGMRFWVGIGVVCEKWDCGFVKGCSSDCQPACEIVRSVYSKEGNLLGKSQSYLALVLVYLKDNHFTDAKSAMKKCIENLRKMENEVANGQANVDTLTVTELKVAIQWNNNVIDLALLKRKHRSQFEKISMWEFLYGLPQTNIEYNKTQYKVYMKQFLCFEDFKIMCILECVDSVLKYEREGGDYSMKDKISQEYNFMVFL